MSRQSIDQSCLLFTVNAGGVHGIAHERLAGAGVERDVAPADGFEDAQAVLGGVLEGGVAVDGAHAEEVDVGVVRGEENGEGVLGTWLDGLDRDEACWLTSWPGS